MMKKLIFILICSALWLPVMAQNAKKIDKGAQKMMKTAERYIPKFHRKDVIKYYPICCILIQKKYKKLRFDAIPSYEEIEQYLDFERTPVDMVLAKTDEMTWDLMGKYTNNDSYCYGKAKSIPLYNYLDSVKADRAYFLFGQHSTILIEKNGVRYLIKKLKDKYIKCQLKDLFSIGDLNFWFRERCDLLRLVVIGYGTGGCVR